MLDELESTMVGLAHILAVLTLLAGIIGIIIGVECLIIHAWRYTFKR